MKVLKGIYTYPDFVVGFIIGLFVLVRIGISEYLVVCHNGEMKRLIQKIFPTERSINIFRCLFHLLVSTILLRLL